MKMLENKKPLAEEIFQRVERGKEGALAVFRDSEGSLVLWAARRTFPVVELRIQLDTGGVRYAWTHENFDSTLLLDDHGEFGCEARLAVIDTRGQQIVAADSKCMIGRVLIVATSTEKDGKTCPVTGYALFQAQPGETPRSAVLMDASDEFLSFADLDWELALGGLGDGGI